jgi:hypothetical protein
MDHQAAAHVTRIIISVTSMNEGGSRESVKTADKEQNHEGVIKVYFKLKRVDLAHLVVAQLRSSPSSVWSRSAGRKHDRESKHSRLARCMLLTDDPSTSYAITSNKSSRVTIAKQDSTSCNPSRFDNLPLPICSSVLWF